MNNIHHSKAINDSLLDTATPSKQI